MYIRYRRERNAIKNSKVHVTTVGNTRYEFWAKDGWACDVGVKKHVDWLLSGKGSGKYEVAYDRYGIHFQPSGQEIKQNGHPVGVLQEAITQLAAGAPVQEVNAQLQVEATPDPVETTPSPRQKMGLLDRVKKMQAARNANRIAKGLPPIEFKS